MSAFQPWDSPRFKHQMLPKQLTKAAKKKAEATVAKAVRAECEERDGYCLVLTRVRIEGQCKGPSEWAHFAGHRRSQTRGLPPEQRHDTRFSGILCRKHHRQEDAGTFGVVYRTVDYANGKIDWEPRESKAA